MTLERTTTMKARRKEPTPSSRTSVLVVEDEEDLQELLRYNLQREGFNVQCAGSGEMALRMARQEPPGLILLDLMLPGMDGLEVCRALRTDAATSKVPIVMVTAKGEESDVVSGLELGADDYVPKPFSPRVLVARIRAVLRRKEQEAEETADTTTSTIHHRDIHIHPDRHEVAIGSRKIELTATEFKLLTLLVRRPGRVFTRQQIIEAIHGTFSAVTDRSVDVQVVMLRRKLEERGDEIQTVRGVGYRFKE